MIKLENVVLASPEQMAFIIEGMRNPMNSWEKSDSIFIEEDEYYDILGNSGPAVGEENRSELGPDDLSLMQRLSNAGTEHRKYLRMMPVYVRITAPLYWWSEFDTYKVGTVANSCSKMHKLLSKPFEMSDFSFDKLPGYKFEPKQYRPEVDEDLEEWLEIPDAQDGWLISNYGRVKHNGKILSCSIHSDGYIFSVFKSRKTGKYIQRPVHRLVAEAFLPVVIGKDVINHVDGNKMNNSVMNLEWCTQSENVKHAIDNHFTPRGLTTYQGKFSPEERQHIKDLWDSGDYSRRKIAEMYGVSHTCVNDIINDRYRYATKENIFENFARPIIDTLNELRDSYFNSIDQGERKQIWYSIIQLLPSSYNQTRNVMLNYEVLANIYRQRKNHKLDEWREVCKWIETLPYSELITGLSIGSDQSIEEKRFTQPFPWVKDDDVYCNNCEHFHDCLYKGGLADVTTGNDIVKNGFGRQHYVNKPGYDCPKKVQSQLAEDDPMSFSVGKIVHDLIAKELTEDVKKQILEENSK